MALTERDHAAGGRADVECVPSPVSGEALNGERDRRLVAAGAVDVAPKRPVERDDIGA
jgi:hypothetical protein